jgi:hypothetical protein
MQQTSASTRAGHRDPGRRSSTARPNAEGATPVRAGGDRADTDHACAADAGAGQPLGDGEHVGIGQTARMALNPQPADQSAPEVGSAGARATSDRPSGGQSGVAGQGWDQVSLAPDQGEGQELPTRQRVLVTQ